MAGPDLSVFSGQTLLGAQQLQQAFEAQKQQQALQAVVLARQAAGVPDGAALLASQDRQARIAEQAQTAAQASQDRQAALLQGAQNHQDSMTNAMAIAQMGQAGRTQTTQDKADVTAQNLADKQDRVKSNDQNTLQAALDANNAQLALIDKIKASPGVGGNFGLAGALPNVSGSDASNANALLNQLDARAFVGAIGNMKSQSRTGASGLGALSEREGDKIQAAASAAGNRKQGLDSFNANLDAYATELKASNDRLTNGFNNIYNKPAVAPTGAYALPAAVANNPLPSSQSGLPTIASPNDPAFSALGSGAQFVGPDGQVRIKH